MNRNLPVALLSTLAIATAAFANAGPPPLPKGHKVAEPVMSFEGIDKHPDTVFHLYYYGYFVKRTLIEVTDSKAIKLDFMRKESAPQINYMALKAMDRKEFDKRKKADPELKWFDDPKADGVLTAKLTPPATTVPIASKEMPAAAYRVTLQDGKLSAEKTESKNRDGDRPTGLLPLWTFGIVGSLSIAWLGIWFVRREAANR